MEHGQGTCANVPYLELHVSAYYCFSHAAWEIRGGGAHHHDEDRVEVIWAPRPLDLGPFLSTTMLVGEARLAGAQWVHQVIHAAHKYR